MKTKIVTTLTSLLIFAATAYGQTYEPLDLAKKIFGKEKLTNIEYHVTGEYTGRPSGQDLKKNSITKFTLLQQTDNKAVVTMTILKSSNERIDTYLYFQKDTIWKMNAFRALAMTGIIEQAKIELERLTPLQVDEMITKSKTKKKDKFKMFTSRKGYEFQLGNVKLTLNLDENIIQHFLKNQTAFESLKNLALAQLNPEELGEEKSLKLIENLKADYQKLFISSVSTGGYELGKCINFLIGGILDNSVGYIYVEDKKDLPEMTSNRVIMLREIGNGWYIYKTT
ncbi:MAG: hypothetical protein EOO96_01210 [Pedobacter sp.]|nr:MAG: hypothetical protein EOO96_01210 [Pedobacter sp.]